MSKGGSTCVKKKKSGRKWSTKKSVVEAKAALQIGDIVGQVQYGRVLGSV